MSDEAAAEQADEHADHADHADLMRGEGLAPRKATPLRLNAIRLLSTVRA